MSAPGCAILEVRPPGGQSYRLESGAYRIGRNPDNAIRIDDPTVSALHGEIVVGPQGGVIRDLGSSNGIFIGGTRTGVGSLGWGIPFRIGGVECVLHEPVPQPVHPLPSHPGWRWRGLDREARRALGVGLGLALGVCVVPLFAYIIDFLRLIIHETGHTVTAWAFGYPTLPMLLPGGAVSTGLPRPAWALVLILAVLGRLVYGAYRTRRSPGLVALGACAYLVVAVTDLRLLVITLMGHGAELLVASLFLYRALSGRSILAPAERPLYATVAFVVFGLDTRFALQLLFGGEAEYRQGLEGHAHDLVLLADQYLHVPLGSVVLTFLLLCLISPCIVFLQHGLVRRRADPGVVPSRCVGTPSKRT